MNGGALANPYDPFVRGRFLVGVRTIQARDMARARLFPCELWYPAVAHLEPADPNDEQVANREIQRPPEHVDERVRFALAWRRGEG